MLMIVHPTYLVLSSATLSYEIFCCSFQIKSLLFPPFHNREMNFKIYPYLPVGVCCIETPTNHLHTTFVKINQWSLYLLLSFLYYIIKIRNKHTIPHYTTLHSKIIAQNTPLPYHYLHIPLGKLEHRIDSLSSLRHITCKWKAASSQPTILLDVIAVYPSFPKYLLIKTNQGPYLK